jgi:hypothetical protein
MATRKSSKRTPTPPAQRAEAPDKFHVGQHVIIMDALSPRPFWKALNGQRGVITGPKEWGPVSIDFPDGRPTGSNRREERYTVRCSALRSGSGAFHESQLRPIDDGDGLSTWDRFEKLTGLQLTGTQRAARPIKVKKAKKVRSRTTARETSHG